MVKSGSYESIAFHAGKLELMAEILDAALKATKDSGYIPPQDFDITHTEWRKKRLKTPDKDEKEEWKKVWGNYFGEDFPSVYKLIELARATVASVVAKYPLPS